MAYGNKNSISSSTVVNVHTIISVGWPSRLGLKQKCFMCWPFDHNSLAWPTTTTNSIDSKSALPTEWMRTRNEWNDKNKLTVLKLTITLEPRTQLVQRWPTVRGQIDLCEWFPSGFLLTSTPISRTVSKILHLKHIFGPICGDLGPFWRLEHTYSYLFINCNNKL